MVKVFLRLSSEGLLRECRVKGHAESGEKGHNLICAAVTVLVRTAVRTLENRNEPGLEGEAPEPGELGFKLNSQDSEPSPRLQGITDFLLTGLLDLQEEYPEDCRVYLDRQGKE